MFYDNVVRFRGKRKVSSGERRVPNLLILVDPG